MTVHQCPKCELRFVYLTELDDHCRTDHPQFHHDYPVRGVHHNNVEGSDIKGSDTKNSSGAEALERPELPR